MFFFMQENNSEVYVSSAQPGIPAEPMKRRLEQGTSSRPSIRPTICYYTSIELTQSLMTETVMY